MQNKRERTLQILFLLPLLILGTGLVLSFVGYNSSYDSVERYQVKYPNNDIPIIGNVYYPKYSVYESPPVIVYMSGFMMQKDLNPRVPLEFCRRGFVVVSVDMHGHGEMDGVFGPMAYIDGKNVIDYIFDYLYSEVNTSQVAVMGHSAGVLGALSLNDSRVQTTVTWAAPVYYSIELIEDFEDEFSLYNPEIDLSDLSLIEELNESAPFTFINTTNPKNLLTIHHVDDPIVNVSHAMEISNKTNCELLILNSSEKGYMFLDNVDGSAHGLTYDTVMIHTINWIESHLGLDTIPVTDSYRFASKTAMLAMTFSIVGLICSGFTIVYFFGKLSSKSKENSKLDLTPFGDRMLNIYKIKEKPVLKQLLPFFGVTLILFIGFFASWGIIGLSTKFKMNWIFIVPSILLGIILVFYFLMVKIKITFKTNNILFGIGASLLLLGGFIFYTVGFRSLILYPHYFINFVYAFLLILPWTVISNIVLWKILMSILPDIIFDPLTNFSERTYTYIQLKIYKKKDTSFTEERKKVCKFRWKTAHVLLIQFLFNFLTLRIVPFAINALAVSILMIISGFLTGLYYYLRRELTGIIIMNVLILSYFYSTCYWFFPNFA